MRHSFAVFIAAVLFAGCIQSQSDPPKLQVAASIYPLAFLAQRIGGDKADVLQVVPNGVEPHDYEPTPQQLATAFDSKIMVSDGQGLDPWVEKTRDQFAAKEIAIIVATEGMDLLPAMEDEEDKPEFGASDPHVWLDPVHMQSVAVRIRDAFIAADPADADAYRANADALLADLRSLDQRFRASLAHCAKTKVIVSHNAFRYMARRYGFQTLALAGISPDEEPSPKTMAGIIDTAKREKLTVVFFETLVSPKLAEAVAKGAGVRSMILDPLEGLTSDEMANGDTYLTIMARNAKNLSIALECQQ